MPSDERARSVATLGSVAKIKPDFSKRLTRSSCLCVAGSISWALSRFSRRIFSNDMAWLVGLLL
ncbi:hypothetical protein [Moraxella lacunata]|uniref:hypothetical protein n=1 Tax=Moraxella lacunata TaxID=477 RepID=UPI003EDEF32D